MNVQEYTKSLTEKLQDTDLKISLIPEMRVPHLIYSLIDEGKRKFSDYSNNEETEFEDLVGRYSDEPDNNELEILLTTEAIDFWSIIIADVFKENTEYVNRIINNLKVAQNSGFAYVRLSQY